MLHYTTNPQTYDYKGMLHCTTNLKTYDYNGMLHCTTLTNNRRIGNTDSKLT